MGYSPQGLKESDTTERLHRGSLGVSLARKWASVRRTEFLLLCVATPATSAGFVSGLLGDPPQALVLSSTSSGAGVIIKGRGDTVRGHFQELP